MQATTTPRRTHGGGALSNGERKRPQAGSEPPERRAIAQAEAPRSRQHLRAHWTACSSPPRGELRGPENVESGRVSDVRSAREERRTASFGDCAGTRTGPAGCKARALME